MGNLLGEPFKDYVDAQINVRQEVHGKVNRDLKDLQYLNSKNAWIKLASGTSFEQERLDLLLSPSPSIKNPLLTGVVPGQDLAIKNVLFNGLTTFKELRPSFDSITQTQRAGITGANRAYGVGGTEQGYSPMPGILNADIKDLNRGSIKKATINLVAHNRNQFDVIDALYLRLGYTVMLEWGVDKYLHSTSTVSTSLTNSVIAGALGAVNTVGLHSPNSYTLENMGTTLIDKKFWRYRNSSYNEILPEIESLRKKYQGNYDGMFGVISNFSWTFEADGSYKIKLEIMSQGDVIESLKANTPPTAENGKDINKYDKFARSLAVEKVTTDEKSFFAIYPGLKEIIEKWQLNARSTTLSTKLTSASFNVNVSKVGMGVKANYSTFTSNFPSLKVETYSSDKSTSPIKNKTNISQAEELDDFFINIINNSLREKTKTQEASTNPLYTSQNYLGEFEDLSLLQDASLEGGKKTSTKYYSFLIGNNTKRSYVYYSLQASFRRFEKENRIVEGEINNSQKDGIARMWIANNLETDVIILKTLIKYQDKNYAGGPNDAQFSTQQPDESAPPEEIEAADIKKELELKKDKNRVNSYLYKVRNVWQEGVKGKPYSDFDGNFQPITLGIWEVGKGINPIGKNSTGRTKTWNKEVGFPIYPRVINVPLNPTTLKPTSGGSMGDTGSDRPNSVDFIRLNLTSPNKQHFIRLGVFLEFLEQNVIPKIETGSNKNHPLLSIDYHPENNICYTIDNVLSLNPNKIILKNQSFYNGTSSESVFNHAKDFKRSISGEADGPIWGNIMNLYFNFARIEELFESVDEKNSVSVYSILKNLTTDINESLGNINNIEPIIDKETNTIKFIDQSPIPELEAIARALKIDLKPQSTTQLEIFGINPTNNTSNFVRSAGITTEISKEYATMITIGATANGAIPGTEATAFSKWNIGIKDRFKTSIVDSETKEGSEELEKQNEGVLKSYVEFIERGISTLGFTQENKNIFTINEDLIELNKSAASNYYIYAQAETSKANDTIESSIGFLPFNLKLSMDGLSGIKIYNKVNVNTSFLPSNYGDTLSFIITGVNHKLSGNEWVTSLDTIATSKTKQT